MFSSSASCSGSAPSRTSPIRWTGNAQLAQNYDLLQLPNVCFGIVPVAVFIPGGCQQPLLFIKADIGLGDPKELFGFVDLHGNSSLFIDCTMILGLKQG